MSQILGIDEQVKGFIKRVVDHAESNKISIETIKAIMAGIQKPAGDDNNFVCFIPVGFRVVYSIEEHPMGWCRHISISTTMGSPDNLPNVPVVEMIIKEFGFKGPISDQIHAWIEDTTPKAVNVLGEY